MDPLCTILWKTKRGGLESEALNSPHLGPVWSPARSPEDSSKCHRTLVLAQEWNLGHFKNSEFPRGWCGSQRGKKSRFSSPDSHFYTV